MNKAEDGANKGANDVPNACANKGAVFAFYRRSWHSSAASTRLTFEDVVLLKDAESAVEVVDGDEGGGFAGEWDGESVAEDEGAAARCGDGRARQRSGRVCLRDG